MNNRLVPKTYALLTLVAAAVAAWVLVSRPSWTRTFLPSKQPRNLLLVSLDTVRADRLGSYGHRGAQTPRLDAIAASGLRFDRATTVVPLTLPAHTSLMTGTFSAWHGVRDNAGFYLADRHITLAEVLRDRGYRTGGFIGAFVLDRRWGIAQGFERYFDEFDLDRFPNAASMDMIERPGAEVVDKALEWLGSKTERPFFVWVHLYDPHAPYEPREPFENRFPRTPDGAYDAEIAYVDAQVGRLLDALERDGRLQNTVVVVVGDHGEMLGEHGEQQHGFFIYEAATRVPLIIAGPGVPARVVSDQVRIVDVMPTALALLGVETPAAVQGADLAPLGRGERLDLVSHSESWYPRYHYGWSELRAIQDGRFKYIEAPRPEVYDLMLDPGEKTNLAADPAQATRLATFQAALAALEARVAGETANRGPETVDPEVAERLAALGYVGSSISPRNLADRTEPRGDPKDKVSLYMAMKHAGSASLEGRQDEAIAIVEKALKQDPEMVEAYMLLGNFLKLASRPKEAIAAYRQALALDGEHQGALFSLAVAYKDEGQLDDALVGLERARAMDPRNGRVLWQLADVWLRKKQPARAEEVIRDALAKKVDQERFLLKLGETQLEAKQFDEAERTLKAAISKKASLETAHFALGLVYEEKREIDKAIASYRTELQKNDRAYRAAFNLAKLLQHRGRLSEAVPLFQKVIELQPKFGTGHLYLANALLNTGDLAGAERYARTGLANRPDQAIAPLGHYVLADVYERRGRPADAQRELTAARRLTHPPKTRGSGALR
jgi:choline-sulfatase